MIHVAIIEDERRYWDILKILLEQTPGVSVVHISDNCLEIVNDLKFKQADVLIMDINLPYRNGIDAVAEIKQRLPEIKTLMFTVHDDDDNVFNAIKAGAIGYVLKYEAAKISEAVKEVYNGRAYINGYLAGKILNYFHEKANLPQLEEYNLTPKEKEILNLLVKGLAYKQIAHQTNISPETINTHIKNIYRKLNVHSRSEIAARFGNF
jgi:DNA-binding NarL/FixJ family response regulator